MSQMETEFFYGPDMLLTMPPPTMIIPSPQMLAVDHPHITADAHGCFTLILPCHEWSYMWLHQMSTHDSLPHLRVTIHCMEDYGQAFHDQHPAAAATLFIAHMMTYGYPPLLRGPPRIVPRTGFQAAIPDGQSTTPA
jgi:hypothetical protein